MIAIIRQGCFFNSPNEIQSESDEFNTNRRESAGLGCRVIRVEQLEPGREGNETLVVRSTFTMQLLTSQLASNSAMVCCMPWTLLCVPMEYALPFLSYKRQCGS